MQDQYLKYLVLSIDTEYWDIFQKKEKENKRLTINLLNINHNIQVFFLNVDNKFIQEKFGNNKMFYSQPVY